ncbi:MAG: exodeoxyribonuclease III [Lachnoclostridium sp.]|jgi:exodeoxyribonuclease III|nr:exodeoxyribonuclease III [Lachnoclostridium sp.]MDD7521480.1 exodeoxyribonuclease III [Lachnoclostridium sp.]
MIKFISWNIDSINAALTSESARAVLSRKVLETIQNENADIIAIQETKLPATGPSKKHLEELDKYFPDYQIEWVSSLPPARKGYAGTMVLYRKGMEASVSVPRIGAPDTMDDEGRLLTVEFKNFYFVNVYTPNAGDGLKRLAERQKWDVAYADYLSQLNQNKPLVACGDFNVAHEEIDLANPASNHMSAGFTDEERAGFTNLLSRGFVDTFRHLHGDVRDVYSWWAQRIRTSKINNSGWRIDYFLVSDCIKDKVVRSEMLDSGDRQDHAPLVLELDI